MRPPGLPEGTLPFEQARRIFGVRSDRIERAIGEGHIEVTTHGARRWRYFTPDQQRAAMAYWDSCGIKYRRPVPAGESEVPS